jgi:ligand-binding sensor domain-containing protein
MIRHDRNANSYELSERLYLENYFCSYLFYDKYGLLWVATNKGLLREKRVRAEFEKITVSKDWNPNGRDLWIRDIVTANDKIFAGTIGESLLVFNQSDLKEIKKLDFTKYWPSANYVLNLILLDKDTVLAGTYGPLISIHNKNLSHNILNIPKYYYKGNAVNALFKDSRNNVYLSTSPFPYFYFRGGNEKKFTHIDCPGNPLFNIRGANYIVEDNEGNIWFSGTGMSRFNYRLRDFDILLDSFPAIKLPRKTVTNPVFDKEGNMYFGVTENGLIIYNPTKKNFFSLPGVMVCRIMIS